MYTILGLMHHKGVYESDNLSELPVSLYDHNLENSFLVIANKMVEKTTDGTK